MERAGRDPTPHTKTDQGVVDISATELNIENLGWFRDVLIYAKERNVTDIIAVEKRPVRLGILKKCEVMEIAEGVVVKPGKAEILAAVANTRQRKFKGETDGDAGTAILKHIRSKGYFEYAFSVKDIGRFRMSVSNSQEGLGFAARVLPYAIPRFEDLDPFNMLAGIKSLFDFSYSYPRGLILHTGVVGSGKTTLIASELDYLAERMNGAVYTLEDPIEYVYQNKRTVFRQYEIGVHIPDIPEGVRMALRNNLAGLVVGEVRTREEVTALFTAAEKGFLVISASTPRCNDPRTPPRRLRRGQKAGARCGPVLTGCQSKAYFTWNTRQSGEKDGIMSSYRGPLFSANDQGRCRTGLTTR